MTQEQIIAVLQQYRSAIGRSGHIEAELARLRLESERIREAYARDLASPGAARLDGMPRGGLLSDPTQRVALVLADEEAFAASDAGEAVSRLEARMAALRSEGEACRLTVRYVDSWLCCLTDRERWVIEHRVIESERWNTVVSGFDERFGDEITIPRLKRIQQRGLERIRGIAS